MISPFWARQTIFGQLATSNSFEKFVEFVGGVEVSFEVAGPEAFADFIEAAGQEIERRGKNFAVGQDNVAPNSVRASRKAQ